jgi:hypothetical protein
MTATVTLIAVIGPVEPALLAAWCTHYQQLGVTRFAIALHTPHPGGGPAREALAEAFRAATGHEPQLVAVGPWHEHTNIHLREQLRARAGQGWHLLADADEFQQHPHGLAAAVDAAQANGSGVLAGLLLDRVAADGGFPSWTTNTGLDRAYPLGGLLTHHLLRGDPRKIVLARSDVVVASGNHRAVASGNHRAPGRRPPVDHVVPVHHFKWRAGVVADLHARVEHFTSGRWHETTPAVRLEAGRLLAHLAEHDGRIDVTSGAPVSFHPVTLTTGPPWWPARASAVLHTWRPPAPGT